MFVDRVDAGRRLAERLSALRNEPDLVVVGLPRGGVPVAAEVADALDAPLDVIIVRKVGVPFQPELAMGAIGEDGVRVVNKEVVNAARISHEEFEAVEQHERHELERRAQRFRAGRARIPLRGCTVVVVDDGIATGSTARAACLVARAEGARRVVLAVPVAPPDWVDRLGDAADELIAVETPRDLSAIGQHYRDFSATSDDEVVACLEGATVDRGRTAGEKVEEDVRIPVGGVQLGGHLVVPPSARGLVLFVHGSGSSRHSPRNRHVASVLNSAGLATLLFDLLAAGEEDDRHNVFDIDLLTGRLLQVTDWARRHQPLAGLAVGYFGASTGAAAALSAAAETGNEIAAVVSRGGRPDLADDRLPLVQAPTLLIVGGFDDLVIELNEEAMLRLACEQELVVVDGASHLFEEPGTLAVVAELARDWFLAHLGGRAATERGPDQGS